MNATGSPDTLKAVFFDLDDTLYEHGAFVRGAYHDVASAFAEETGLARYAFETEAWRQFERSGSRDNRIFSRLLEKHGVYSRDLEHKLVNAYRAHAPSISLYPGVMESLRELREYGLALALLSDGRHDVQYRKIRALGLSNTFDTVIVTGDLGDSCNKPNPAGFNKALGSLGVRPREAVMVGDDPKTDVAGALTVGIQALRVLTGQYKHENEPEATATFSNMSEAVYWILSERSRRNA